ncbi:hypothetical protein BH09BAC5_BH09BAC5_24610 [soil metagenome]
MVSIFKIKAKSLVIPNHRMMKRSNLLFLQLFIFSLFLSFEGFSQFATPQWVSQFNSIGYSTVQRDFKVDSAGFSYSFFDVGDSNNAIAGAYIIKYDPAGQLLWSLRVATNSSYGDGKLCLTNSNSIYTSIPYWNGSGIDIQLSKIDTAGIIIWQDSIGSPQNNVGGLIAGMVLDKSENILIIGTTQNLDSSVIIKCDSAGNLNWIKYNSTYDGPYDRGKAIDVDFLGNVYVAIASMDSTYFYNSVIAKYTPIGQLIWQDRFVDTLSASPQFLKVFSDTIIYVNGVLLGNSGGSDYQTFKLDSAGNVLWSKIFDAELYYNFPSNVADNPHAMLVTRDGNVAITGDCVNNGMPWWVNIMYDKNGNLKWVGRDDQYIGYGRSIAEDPAGNLVFAGEIFDMTQGILLGISKYDTLGNRAWISGYTDSSAQYYLSKVGLDYMGNIYGSAGNLLNYAQNSVTTLKYDYTVGISRPDQSDYFALVFPNPSVDFVHIEFKENCNGMINIYDQFGKNIYVTQINNKKSIQIPVSTFVPGIYFFAFLGNDEVQTSGKFVVQKK